MILSVEGISKWFGEPPARTDALREVSFTADYNEMLYIVGPSGSGKTTLLRRALRDSAPECRHRASRRQGYLASR